MPYCGSNPISDMWSEKAMSLLASAFRRAVHHGDDTDGAPRDGDGGDVRRVSASATPACTSRTPTPTRSPGRVKDFRPEGYPDDEPMVPHGMAVSLTAPEAFRWTFEASPERHLQRRRAARARPLLRQGPDALASVLTDLMRDITIPNGLGAVGYDEGDVDDLVEGTMKQQRLLATAPREVTEDDAAGDPHPLARAVVSSSSLVDALHRHGITDVDDSALARSLYASDAALYRIPPLVVVRPRDTDEVVATLAVARETGTPLTMRGAGTSIAGNAIGAGHRHRHQPAPRPGARRSTPRRAPRTCSRGWCTPRCRSRPWPLGLRFGPDPSTHTRCTIGGMIGNNACGSRALGLRPHRRQRRGADGAAGRRDGGACLGGRRGEDEPSRPRIDA